MTPLSLVPLFIFFVLAAGDAEAHVVAPGTPLSFLLHHPAFEPVHALAFIGGGLWAGQQAGRTGWIWIGLLVAGVILGIVLGKLLWLPPGRSVVMFAVIVAFGVAVAARWQPVPWMGACVYGIAGIYNGVVGTIPHYMGGSGHYAVPDIAVAAILLSLLSCELSSRARPEWAIILLRILGSWIAATGILLTAFTLRIYMGVTPAAGHSN